MYKLIRFYNQNRRKIIKAILIIVFIIGGIQLLNYFAKNNKNTNISVKNNTIINNSSKYDEIISDKSLISGENVSSSKLQKDSNNIKEFIEFCNNKDINSAYELLSEACKEEMFPTIEDFYNVYYKMTFNNKTRMYTIENWVEDTYQVRFTEDILSSGNLNGNETKQDYITITKEDGENKLNINSYIGRKISNKVTKDKDIEVTIKNIDTYMDYETYNLSIKNNSDNTILLDTSDDTKSVYLLDSKKMKYYFYSGEIIENKLFIESKFTKNIQIKFTNSHSSSRKINKLVFSKLVLNYDEYKNLEDKQEYQDFYQFEVNI